MKSAALWPVLLVPAMAVGAMLFGAMSRSGAFFGAILGIIVAGGAGWSGLAMLSTLLVFGTLVSARKHRRRDAIQAFCNGGVAAFAALAGLFGANWGEVAIAAALSTALSDTVAGECGVRFGGQPRSLLFGKKLEPGVDGGMTWIGTWVSIPAALLVPVVGMLCGADFSLGAVFGITVSSDTNN